MIPQYATWSHSRPTLLHAPARASAFPTTPSREAEPRQRASRACGLLASLGAVALALGASLSAQASDKSAIFEPLKNGISFVPLSEFRAAPGGVQETLHVRSEILQWVDDFHTRNVQVASRAPNGVITMISSSALVLVDINAGTVKYTPPTAASLVVVHNALRNDFVTENSQLNGNGIVTHWRQDSTYPRGKWEEGYSDGILRVDYTPGEPDLDDPEAFSGWSILEPSIPPPAGYDYTWNTTDFALFTDASGAFSNAVVPAHERYLAEDFSLTAYTNLAALFVSDYSRALTGLPIAHRNHPWGLDPSAPVTRQLQIELPILQILHGYVVEYDPAGGPPGSENSLATFVVPPFWRPDALPRYPVVFNSYYNVSSYVFGVPLLGEAILGTIGRLHVEDGRGAIGILSNGGGANATVALQESSTPNIAQLFEEAELKLGVDKTKVVVTGGSRGGTAGLKLACDPAAGFTAKYVMAANPNPYPITTLEHSLNPTYALAQVTLQLVTGYRHSYVDGWLDPVTGRTAFEQALHTLYGSDDPATIEQAGSSDWLDSLALEGTTIIMRIGTHDPAGTFRDKTEYMEALLQHDIPHRVEIGYRMGHHYAVGTSPNELDLMRHVLNNTSMDPAELRVVHYRFKASATETNFHFDDPIAAPIEEFFPVDAPMFIEAPLRADKGRPHTYTIVGPPGTPFVLQAGYVPAAWTPATQTLVCPPPVTLPNPSWITFHAGSLPAATHPDQIMTAVTYEFPAGPASLAGPWMIQLKANGLEVLGETSVPKNHCEDTYPISLLQDINGSDEQLGKWILDRTGGLSQDSSL